MQINYEDDEVNNAPPGVSIETPGRRLVALTVYNDGPGDLYFATVAFSNSTRANALLKAGEKFELKTDAPVLNFLNLAAKVNECNVRLMGLY